MRKILLFVLILILISVFSGCFFIETEQSFRVYYHRGSAGSGSAPVDTNKYNYGDVVIIEGKGTLEKEDHMFLGWMNYGDLHWPGEQIQFFGSGDLHFTASWNDEKNTTFEFIIEGDEVKITKYKYAHENIIIPSTYSGKPVTEIADGVFQNKGIYSVTLPKNLKRIGSYAFADCRITSLIIPDSLESIGPYAFANCRITSLTIPDSLESIGFGAFENNNINKITFGTGRTSITRGVFKKNKIISVNLPDNITLIEDEAFSGNIIGQIIIGDDVEIESDTSFGTRGASFKKFYDDNGKQAGEYGYTANFWVKL